MDNTEENELFDVLIRNYEEASVIEANFKNALKKLKNIVRESIFNKLKERIKDKFDVSLGRAVDDRYSQIWIRIKDKTPNKIFFGIQSFALHEDEIANGQLYIGIFVFNGDYKPEYERLGNKVSNWWTEIQEFEDFDNNKVSMANIKTLKRLHSDEEFREGFVNHIVIESDKYLNLHSQSVVEFL